jgi:hypothetical protein
MVECIKGVACLSQLYVSNTPLTVEFRQIVFENGNDTTRTLEWIADMYISIYIFMYQSVSCTHNSFKDKR